MTKEELAKEIVDQFVRFAHDQILFRVVMPDNIGSTTVNINLHRTEPGVTAAIRDAIQSAIVEGIDRYIRATVPESPEDIGWMDDLRSRAFGRDSDSNLRVLFRHIDHLERTITMLMDEGNVYQQGRDAAKAEWEDERKELVEVLKEIQHSRPDEQSYYSACPFCFEYRPNHSIDCRLARVIGAEQKEHWMILPFQYLPVIGAYNVIVTGRERVRTNANPTT